MSKKSLMMGVMSLSMALALPGCLRDFQSPPTKAKGSADTKAKTSTEPKKPLYDRLGGAAAVKAVAEEWVARAAVNPRVNFTRKGTAKEWNPTPEKIAKLQGHVADLIGALSGGPHRYLKQSHAGLGISNFEFDWLIGDLVESLKKVKVPEKDADELVGVIAAKRGEIVEVQ